MHRLVAENSVKTLACFPENKFWRENSLNKGWVLFVNLQNEILHRLDLQLKINKSQFLHSSFPPKQIISNGDKPHTQNSQNNKNWNDKHDLVTHSYFML